MQDEVKKERESQAIFCDDCAPVKHYGADPAFVNVRLCPKHAATDSLLAAAEAALRSIEEAPLLNNSGVSPKDFSALMKSRSVLKSAINLAARIATTDG